MLEFEPFLNGFRFLFLFVHGRGFRLAVFNVSLVIAMLFGLFSSGSSSSIGSVGLGLVSWIAYILLGGWESTVLGCSSWGSIVLVYNGWDFIILGRDGAIV